MKKLIDVGKEKGYLTYGEVNDMLPGDINSPDDLDDLLTTIGTQGIDVLEGPKMPGAGLDKKFNGTVPISRRYMRTGSLVFSSAPGVRSSSTSSPASSSSNFLSRPAPGIFGPSSTSIPCVPIVVSRSSRSSGLCTSCGIRSLT